MKKPSRFQKLGMGRSVRLAWMDMALSMTLNGHTPAECRTRMTEFIAGEGTAGGERGLESARKAARFTACWYSPTDDLAHFHDQLVAEARQVPRDEWRPLHWALLIANYPFLLGTATVIGRLFSLQGRAEKGQVEKRLRDIYGAQPFIERNMRYAISTLLDFGLVAAVGRTGVYTPSKSPVKTDAVMTALLWKALLHGTEGGSLPYTTLRNSPAYFPFTMADISLGQFAALFNDVKCDHFLGSDDLVSIMGQSPRCVE